jgi:predicted CopG family antitoxin
MTPVATATTQTTHMGWFSKTEAWLDNKGKGAWIAAMVLGFIFVWPVGLALLFYMIWSKRMFSKSRSMTCGRRRMHTMTSTGNSAFDSYRDEMIRRLEDEQKSFEEFLQRLREAKDKSEFDQFMDEREKKAQDEAVKEDA